MRHSKHNSENRNNKKRRLAPSSISDPFDVLDQLRTNVYLRLPIDMIHLIALYLSVSEIIRFAKMNKMHYSLIYKNLSFAKKLAFNRLSVHDKYFDGKGYFATVPKSYRHESMTTIKYIFVNVLCTRIAYAAGHGFEILVRRLVEAGKFITDELEEVEYIVDGENIHHALCGAASAGRLDIVQYLVDHNANINIKFGDPALCRAVSSGYFDIVKYLLSKGAQVFNSSDGKWVMYDNAIMAAIYGLREADESERDEIIKYLLEYDLDPEQNDIPADKHKDYSHILYIFIKFKVSSDLIKYLISKNIRLTDVRNFEKYEAFCKCDIEIKEYLFSRNIIDQRYDLPPHITHLSPMENYFIFVNLRHPDHVKHMIAAASRRFFQIIDYLTKYHLKNVNKLTDDLAKSYGEILHYLIIYDGPIELIEFLLDKGAKMQNSSIIRYKFMNVNNTLANLLRSYYIIPREYSDADNDILIIND